MSSTIAKRVARLFTFIILVITLSGCSYLKNRGNDFIDIADVGLTIGLEREPVMALYAQVTPVASLGFSNVEGAYLGLAEREAGALFIEHHAHGVLLWGQEARGIGPTELSAKGRAIPFGQGAVRMAKRGDHPSWKEWADIQAAVHIGWFGAQARLRPMQAIDFITGIFFWDMLGDDTFPRPEDYEG